MKVSLKISRWFPVYLVTLLYVLLFIYAGTIKLLDYENFSTQIGQSPMLSPFAEFLAVVVPVIEILISLLLLSPRTRLLGLYAATGLMSMFTVYIYAILNFGTFVPCSCGGILEKMSWHEHLVFNLIFVALGITAIYTGASTSSIRMRTLKLSGLLVISVGIVAVLLYRAERITQYENQFIRRISSTSIMQIGSYDLKYTSYYFAGISDKEVHLGNTTAQLLLTSVDTGFTFMRTQKIELQDTTLPFRSVSLRTIKDSVFAFDGTVPVIFSGVLGNNLKKMNAGTEFFTLAHPTGPEKMIVRTQRRGDWESILGYIDLKSNAETRLFTELLEKQVDGLFDTDGTLLFSKSSERMVYLYAYRNGYLISDKNLRLIARGHTIDTLTSLNVAVKEITGRGEKTFAKKPLIANRTATLYGNLLFVNSGMPGKFEEARLWKRASIIDVYDIEHQRYLSSFFLNDIDGKRMRQFYVEKDVLYALIGRHLVRYRINEIIAKHYATKR